MGRTRAKRKERIANERYSIQRLSIARRSEALASLAGVRRMDRLRTANVAYYFNDIVEWSNLYVGLERDTFRKGASLRTYIPQQWYVRSNENT